MINEEGTSTSSSGTSFQPDGLIWAKMKGFPHWPAKVLAQSEGTPNGRIPVMFFGTKETAFMKPSDCSDYISNKHIHEIPRKLKGFNDGVHEIRVEAGIESPSYRDPVFFDVDVKVPEESGRIRRTSVRLHDSLLFPMSRKRSNSGSRSRASSTHTHTLKLLHKQLVRKRLDSESSNGSKRRQMISGGLGQDPLGLDHFEDGHHWNDTDSFHWNDDARSSRSKRSRGISKVFDSNDFMLMDGSPVRGRNRAASQSDGKRSRLISGVSDIFDELFTTGSLHAAAAEFMNTLDDMPSESSEIFPSLMEREGTPEKPAPLPRPAEFCKTCGSECTLEGNKWRCSSKRCNEWQVMDIQPGPYTSKAPMELKTSKMEELHEEEEEEEEYEESEPITKKEGLITTNQQLVQKMEAKVRKKDKLGKKLKLERKSSKKMKLRDGTEAKTEKKRVQIASPRQDSISPSSSPILKSSTKIKEESAEGSPSKSGRRVRPKSYNVIKTPPVAKNGLRHCIFCNGQVRPQMCGGNKHRWRCVDKKCRKWYGWVRSNDEIPMDLGRKGRHNSVLGKIKLKRKERRQRQNTEKTEASISSAVEAAVAAEHLDAVSLKSGDTGRGSPSRTIMSLAEMKKKKWAAAQSLLKMKGLKGAALNPKLSALKKKYTKKREQQEKAEEEEEQTPPRSPSPLTERELNYYPGAMEKRARWWTGEKRRADPSPERPLQTEMADAAAAFRILSHAFRSAAVTRADEVGTVNGSLDLMMDSLLGCMGPLLSLLSKLPNTRPEPEVVQKLWDASAVHMPIFQ